MLTTHTGARMRRDGTEPHVDAIHSPTMIDGKAADLEEVLTDIAGEPLVIVLCGHPDPDAIGSALAHARICDQVGVPVTIAHVLPLARPENRALVKLLGIELHRITSSADLEPFKYYSLVDASAPDSNLELPEHLQLISVVDHHNVSTKPQAPFVDLRVNIGATCSIYAEYLESGLAPLRPDTADDSKLATALLFGIQTDTDDFALATGDDFRAAAYLKPLCDVALLGRFGHRSMDARAMNALSRALLDLEVVRDFAVAGVGRVTTANRDAIPVAADFILRREDIDTVFVYGIVDDRIDGSLRTTSPAVDPALFMESAFGTDASGRPYGGGRADKGGVQIPIGVLAEATDDETLWKLVKNIVRTRLHKVVPDLGDTSGA